MCVGAWWGVPEVVGWGMVCPPKVPVCGGVGVVGRRREYVETVLKLQSLS